MNDIPPQHCWVVVWWSCRSSVMVRRINMCCVTLPTSPATARGNPVTWPQSAQCHSLNTEYPVSTQLIRNLEVSLFVNQSSSLYPEFGKNIMPTYKMWALHLRFHSGITYEPTPPYHLDLYLLILSQLLPFPSLINKCQIWNLIFWTIAVVRQSTAVPHGRRQLSI